MYHVNNNHEEDVAIKQSRPQDKSIIKDIS